MECTFIGLTLFVPGTTSDRSRRGDYENKCSLSLLWSLSIRTVPQCTWMMKLVFHVTSGALLCVQRVQQCWLEWHWFSLSLGLSLSLKTCEQKTTFPETDWGLSWYKMCFGLLWIMNYGLQTFETGQSALLCCTLTVFVCLHAIFIFTNYKSYSLACFYV